MKWDWKQWNWKHTLGTVLFFSAGADELLLQYVQAGNALPFHVTAAMLLLAGKYIDMVSHSMTGSTGAPDMLGQVAPGALPSTRAAAAEADTGSHRQAPKTLLVLVIALGAMRWTTGCKDLALPSDLVADFQCVQEGIATNMSAVAIEAKCLPGQLQTVLDIVENLLASKQWRAAHPEQITAAEGVRAEARSKLAEGAAR
jgi:hypothetical protein